MSPEAALNSDRLVPLSTVASEGHLVRPEFWAQVDGQPVFVTAVLDRTIVFVAGGERRLTGRANCLVDPQTLVLHPITTTWGNRTKNSQKRAKVLEVVDGVDEPGLDLDDEEDEEEDDGEISTAAGWSA